MSMCSPYSTCELCGHQWKRDFSEWTCPICHGSEEAAYQIIQWRDIEARTRDRQSQIVDLAKKMARFFREAGITAFEKESVDLGLYD